MESTRHEPGETVLIGLPVCGHPKWGEFYQRRADAYDAIAEKCEASGITITMLQELVAAVEDFERLSFLYTLEYNHMGILGLEVPA